MARVRRTRRGSWQRSLRLPTKTSTGMFDSHQHILNWPLSAMYQLRRGRHRAPGRRKAIVCDHDDTIIVVPHCTRLSHRRYSASLRSTPISIIPLPDKDAAQGTPAHISSYQEFPTGATVMALYPDTSCFYRAEVVASPKEIPTQGRVSCRSIARKSV
jgi:hypothetical protein